jgi:phosphoesterase RecJ-like protein
MVYKFAKEFNEIKRELEKAKKVLLVAHARPDGDTIGSVFVLREFLRNSFKKNADVTCLDPFPEYFKEIFGGADFLNPTEIDVSGYDLIIGCDAVERGFEKIVSEKEKGQKIILIDHHPHLEMKKIVPDIVVSDENYSAVCEILFEFFDFHRVEISKSMATYLLTGILGDTGIFQHANTTPRVMEITAALMRKGAPLSKIIQLSFKSKRLETLKLWGRALERARINEKTGAIMSYVTKEDLEELGATSEDISSVAEILNTVSEAKFSLVLMEKDDNRIKGSLRSEWYKNVDVSEIARGLRGGGHRLASGFEIVGKLVKNEEGIVVE